MREFKYKYKVDEEHRTVVAMSSFAGKVVAGVARCAPCDTFNVEIGKRLAEARCALKIAEKRMKRAEFLHSVANDCATFWAERKAKMEEYDADAALAYQQAVVRLATVEQSFE